jgi:hypothetical protein
MLGALAAYFISADPPPPNDVFGVVVFYSEKMTFLEKNRYVFDDFGHI